MVVLSATFSQIQDELVVRAYKVGEGLTGRLAGFKAFPQH